MKRSVKASVWSFRPLQPAGDCNTPTKTFPKNTVMHQKVRRSFTVTCPWLHYLLFTSTAVLSSPRSACSADGGVWNMFLQPCLSKAHNTAFPIFPLSSSVLFTRELTFQVTAEGRNGLYFLLLGLHLAPAPVSPPHLSGNLGQTIFVELGINKA